MLIIGHRGARGLAPENTIAGIKKALELGVDLIEIDARVSSDGIAILNHNTGLKGQPHYKIKNTPYMKLKRLKRDLATLHEALRLIDGRLSVYVEVKAGVDVSPVVNELKKYKGKFLLASKSQKTLRQLHRAMPDVPKIVIEPWSGIRATRRAKEVDAKIISMNKWCLWSGFIKMASRNYDLFTYTLNSPAKAKRWRKYGLAGVVTDYPDRFKTL